ncbi:hypothetical protein HDU91_006958, partial [Kappamyces sp. JEL0680]
MISATSQTVAIIKLNTRRLRNGKGKWGLLLAFLYGFLTYNIYKNIPNRTISDAPPVVSFLSTNVPVVLDPTGLQPADVNLIKSQFSSVLVATRAEFLGALMHPNFNSSVAANFTSQSLPTFVSFDKYDAAKKVYSYSITEDNYYGSGSDTLSLTKLWACVSGRSCSFTDVLQPDFAFSAYVKYRIDAALTGKTPEAFFQSKLYHDSEVFNRKSLVFYNDIFFLALGLTVTKMLLEEKTKGLKFSLFMTGVRRSAYYIGTFTIPVVFSLIVSAFSVFMYVDVWRTREIVAPMIIFTLLSSFGYLAFFFVISQLVTNIRTAALVVTLFTVAGNVSSVSGIPEKLLVLPPWAISLFCIIPKVGFSIYLYLAAEFNVNTFSSVSIPYYAPSAFFTVFWVLVAVYVDSLQVSADETRPWHYLVSQFFEKSSDVIVEDSQLSKAKIEAFATGQSHAAEHMVTISNLSKVYHGSSSKALDNVSIEFGKGEIFGLLGFNGAGKSTLINILVGIISATSGSINVFGLDARRDRREIAARTGICSQQDVLYDLLTAYEHLYYFGLIRGVAVSDITNTIKMLTDDLDMESMLQTKAMDLSGGQKRKLGVALSFIHNPELVVLDEMSSGVDPENRRVIWQFLFKQKQDKAILLCTHFMDEADTLAQRKAVLTLGKVVAIGSSEFLKHSYNTGYTLTIEKRDGSLDSGVFDRWFDRQHLPVRRTKLNPSIVEYYFPANYIDFLHTFESDRELAGAIKSYSIKENGLEEIFSSAELVDEKTLRCTPEEERLLLKYLASFQQPSFLAKTGYFLRFEMKRLFFALPHLTAMLSMSIILTVVFGLIVVGSSSAAASQTTTSISSVFLKLDSDFYSRLAPTGFVVETQNLDALSDPRLVPSGSLSSSMRVLGSLSRNATGLTLSQDSINQNYPVAPFIVVNALVPAPNIATAIEIITVKQPSSNQIFASFDVTNTIIALIIFRILQGNLSVVLVDEVCESREKIKFLLLASGVPLLSYWIGTIARCLLILFPFVLTVTLLMPSSFPIPPVVAVVYLLTAVLLALIVGSIFE